MTDAQPALIDTCHCPSKSFTYGMMRAGTLHHSLLYGVILYLLISILFKIFRKCTHKMDYNKKSFDNLSTLFILISVNKSINIIWIIRRNVVLLHPETMPNMGVII